MHFAEYIRSNEDDKNFNEYIQAINYSILNITNSEDINESFLSDISDKFKDGIMFIKQLAEMFKTDIKDMLKIFKNKFLFTFFNKLKWSISELIDIVKKGYKLQKELHNVIAKFIADNKIVEFTNQKLTLLDEFLSAHPLIKKGTTLIVVGFLIYQWTQMISFTGDIEFDFDQTVLFEAIKGNFSLADLFATPDGVKMLFFIATGVLTGLTFPWPGDAWVLFALSIVYTITKDKYPAIAKNIIKTVKKVKTIKI